jgi:hypothetical protein
MSAWSPSRPKPLAFIPPNGRPARKPGEVSDRDVTGGKLADNAVSLFDVRGRHEGGEPISVVVAHLDAFLASRKARHAQHRTGDFLLGT